MWRRFISAAITGVAAVGLMQSFDPGTRHAGTSHAEHAQQVQQKQFGEADARSREQAADGSQHDIETATGRPVETSQAANAADDLGDDAADDAAKAIVDSVLGG
jgi:hypothetical protein